MAITETRVETPAPAPSGTSDRERHARRLALWLSAPACLVRVLVTAYPLLYAGDLPLYNYLLTDPEGKDFVGLRNYATVIADPVWWTDFTTTLIITVASVAVELVLGFFFAFVMYRILFGRSLVRTGLLIPYGIIT